MLKNQKEIDKSLNLETEKDLDLSKFWDVYRKIKQNYYEFSEIEKQKLIDSSVSGLVNGLGDKHSQFLNKQEKEVFSDYLKGEFEGIGAVVSMNQIGVNIDRVLKGSPAKKYGLKKDDIIVSVDGEKISGLNLNEAVNKIKGPAGTEVKLGIVRSGQNSILEKIVVRNKVDIPSVESEKLEGNIGYISLNSFGNKTELEFKKALDSFDDNDGIIIDLRDNGGGYLEVAVSILSKFIENGKNVVITKDKPGIVGQKLKSYNSGKIYNGKIVVIINENSASASEIVAGALKDYQKAIIIGKKSYGKGSVQVPFYFSDGSMLKLTIAKWFTPKDVNIDKEGIKPDIYIGFKKQDYEKQYDRQKEEAIKLLKTFIKTGALKFSIEKYLELNPEYKNENKD